LIYEFVLLPFCEGKSEDYYDIQFDRAEKSIDSYDPEKGSFSHYLKFRIQSKFIKSEVANSKDNTNSVYFDIYLAGNEETAIYESPIMPVGSHLENIALKEDLDPGTYDCVVKYNLVDEDGNDLSYVRVSLSIVVMD